MLCQCHSGLTPLLDPFPFLSFGPLSFADPFPLPAARPCLRHARAVFDGLEAHGTDTD
jgi:hypothetical protein